MSIESIESQFLSVIILAGGRSSRMGRDKATLEIAGVPMIRRIYDEIACCHDRDGSLASRIHVVTPWAERYRSLLPAKCHFIAELQPDRGSLVGFQQGLAEVSSEWVFLLACDLPNLSTPILQSWIEELGSVPAQSIAYLPRNLEKGWEPLCGCYRRSCLGSLLDYTQNGRRSFQGWLANHLVTELPIADRRYLTNCNTPADLAAVAEISSIELN
jgi:molybdenum cofactor guanylyltransferase